MKTAEQWVEEQSSNPPRKDSLEHKTMCDAVRMIQIDALREAAEIANGECTHAGCDHGGPGDEWHSKNCPLGIRDAILSRIKELEKES